MTTLEGVALCVAYALLLAGCIAGSLWIASRRRETPGDPFYDLRVAESALREIDRQLPLIPTSALTDELVAPVVNMTAAVGAWKRGLVTQQGAFPAMSDLGVSPKYGKKP